MRLEPGSKINYRVLWITCVTFINVSSFRCQLKLVRRNIFLLNDLSCPKKISHFGV